MKKQYIEIDQKYRKFIYQIAFEYLHNKQDAEEATQDTLVKLWMLADRIGSDEKQDRAFIAKIAKCTAINYYKKINSNKYTQIISEKCDLKSLSAEDIVINTKTANRFIDDLRKTDKDAAEILIMRYIDEMSHDEIATKLGITSTASRKRLSRAIKLMKNSHRIKKYKVNPFIIVLIIIAAIFTACAVKPIRNFFVEVFREFTNFRKENTEVSEVYVPEPLEFGYIPKGYSSSRISVGKRNWLFIFSSDDPDKIDFTLSYEFDRPINNKNANSEGGGIKIININGHDCYVTASSKIDEMVATIYLNDSVIEYVGQLDYGEMTKLLESINILSHEKGE